MFVVCQILCFRYIIYLTLATALWGVTLISQMKKLRPRKINLLAWGHTASAWWIQNLNLGLKPRLVVPPAILPPTFSIHLLTHSYYLFFSEVGLLCKIFCIFLHLMIKVWLSVHITVLANILKAYQVLLYVLFFSINLFVVTDPHNDPMWFYRFLVISQMWKLESQRG